MKRTIKDINRGWMVLIFVELMLLNFKVLKLKNLGLFVFWVKMKIESTVSWLYIFLRIS